MNLDRRLLRLAVGAPLFIFLAILAGFLAGIFAILQARQLSMIIARVFLEGNRLHEIMPLMWSLLIIIGVRSVAGFLGDAAASRGAIRAKGGIRMALVRHLFALGPAFAQRERSGEIIHTASQGVEAIDAYFSQYLPQLALAMMLPMAYLAILFPSDPLTGYVLLVSGPLIPLFMYLIGHNAEKLTHRQWTALSRMSAYFLDTLQGLATLKALGRSEGQAERISQVGDRYRQTTLSVLRVTFLSAFTLELLGTMGTAIVAVQIGLRLLYGRIGFEEAFFILLLAPDFYLPLRALGLRFHASMAGLTAARRIFSILETPVPDNRTVSSARPVVSLSSPFKITIDDISYTYPGREKLALDRISFSFRDGESIALAGPSGAGKSTLAILLLRFALPDRGKILVNQISLAEIAADEWRAQIAWVPQHPSIFYGTIADNLRLARPSATLRDLRQAAKNAWLLDFIDSLPQGFETPVGEAGSRLSAGQTQRLALARAFLRDAPFLIMDEPTAHLDVELEEQLRESTRNLCQNRTVLTIAHRLPTILNVDQVLILDEGKIVEAGSPGDLLRSGGILSKMAANYLGKEN